MPGPGPHMMYTLLSGMGLMSVSGGRFTPHHCLTYAINAFFGPDIGSFCEWLTSTLGLGSTIGGAVENLVHHPFFYPLILGFPLTILYSRASHFALNRGFLDSSSKVSLTKIQCIMLIFAGSLSHFFLDHLFEENGNSSEYKWILSTGWWDGRAPINPDAVFIVGSLCACLIAGFIYINRVGSPKSLTARYIQSLILILAIGCLYCLWCASQIYVVNPHRPAVGEEADLGVLVFLSMYFFAPNLLCIQSMNPKDHADTELLPL